MQWVFHMVLWKHVIYGGQFWEKTGYTLDDTMMGESHIGVRKFWTGRSGPRRYHGIVPLDKCHYNFLVLMFRAPILQDSALDIKKLFQSIVCCI